MKRIAVLSRLICLIAIMALFTACNGQKPKMEDEEFNRNKEAYREKIEVAKDNIDKKISELQADLETANDRLKESINSQIGKLEESRDDLNEKLDELGKTTSEKWEDFKDDADKAMNDVEQEIKEMSKEVRRNDKKK